MRLYDIQNEIEMARDREREVKIKKISRILEKRESRWSLNCFWGNPIFILNRLCHAHEGALFRGLVFLKCQEIFVIFYVLFCRSNTLLLFEAGD